MAKALYALITLAYLLSIASSWQQRPAASAVRRQAPRLMAETGGTRGTSTVVPPPRVSDAISLANGARPTASWRIVANFGREPRTGRGMPQSWGADGGRLPIRIEVDVSTAPSTAPGATDGELTIRPRDPLIRYTDFIDGDLRTTTGEKVHPVRPGGWTLDGNKLSFWLEFPQAFSKRDIEVPAGRVYFEGELWTTQELYDLDQAYYAARQDSYRASEAVRDIDRAKERPKVWNEQKGLWERPPSADSAAGIARKRLKLSTAEAKQKKLAEGRPDPAALSKNEGAWPGIGGGVWASKGGGLKIEAAGGLTGLLGGLLRPRMPVVGTWTAEPVLADRVQQNWVTPTATGSYEGAYADVEVLP